MEERLISVISDIDQRLQKLEERIAKIPDPFILYYRPPDGEYRKINEVLDDLHGRLNTLEIVQGI